MDVTDILRDRMQEPVGLQRAITASAVIHSVLILGVLFAPRGFSTHEVEKPRPIMTISLGPGAGGPQNGGMTALSARPVQVQTPPEELPKREAVRPPAAKIPEMTLPKPGAKPLKSARET